MPKYIAVLDIENQYDTYDNSIYHGAIGVDYLELSQEEYNAFRFDFRMNGIVLLEVMDSPQVLLEKFRMERVEKLRKEAEENARDAIRRAAAKEKRKQKAEALRLKKEEEQLEAARKLLREKGELQ